MESYICQTHDRAWMAVEDGYKSPVMTPTGGEDDVLKLKSRKGPISIPSKKQKGIALKASKVEKEEEKDDSDKDMSLLMRRFKRFDKTKNKGFGYKGQDLKKRTPFQENKKGRVMAATWSGSDDSDKRDESSDDEELMANFIAFASSHKSEGASEEEDES
ncbi:hypothetical protein LWI28_001424 [Acer negundo]|uniref:Uncharacterized protein n=1 Tax=Acer negundo TaxID=4023 RepID=A0AAD5JCX4_ACENE|nr:hypothetical protein LWI28_001424 [Acer negundo]